jgi:hypothetical protein
VEHEPLYELSQVVDGGVADGLTGEGVDVFDRVLEDDGGGGEFLVGGGP